jgi:uncharacterized protein (DUF1800 family)
MNPQQASTAAAIAAHRFGLGEPQLQTLASDPQGWLLAQIGPAPAQRAVAGSPTLPNGVEGLRRFGQFLRAQRAPGFTDPQQANRAASGATAGTSAAAMLGGSMDALMGGPPGSDVGMMATNRSASSMVPARASAAASDSRSTEAQFVEHFRALVQGDVRARLATAATSDKPFNERLALFWANHFTVSQAKATARGIVGAFEREAIRPYIGGRFEDLLKAAVNHAGMLRYLDNDQSAGPKSAVVQRLARAPRREGEPGPRLTGLNENLAREVLELHTLGVAGGGSAYGGWGGYTQADVTEFARVLTGWRVPLREIEQGSATEATRFEANWHDPGEKTILGKRYAAGPQALAQVLADLARHPSTARFLSYKLARHVVADEPAPALVARLERALNSSEGSLPALYRALVEAPESWAAPALKLKTPEEFVISTARLLRLGEQAFTRQPDGGIGGLGQRVQAAPSPAGWPDRAEDWLGPDAVWKRVEWATRVAALLGRQTDARSLAREALGERLSEDSARQIERAADGPQALALLLMAPEFQRR